MITYNITEQDKNLFLQREIHYRVSLEILDDNLKILDRIEGTVDGGNVNIDSTSDVRRTMSLTIVPTYFYNSNMVLSPTGYVWVDKTVHLIISIYNNKEQKYIEYSNGYFYYTNVSGSYNVDTNQLSLSLSDFTIALNDTKNGQTGGAITLKIPAYKENPQTGKVIEYNVIRDAMIATLEKIAKIKSHIVEDMGESFGLPEFNNNYFSYRQNNPLWNNVPYDLEFSAGTSIFQIISELRDLYPNYETFFDPIENNFVCQLIPSRTNDTVVLDNDFFKRVLISEDKSVDLTTVKNVCEVWGQVLDVDFFTNQCSYSNRTYNATIEEYDEYKSRDLIGIKLSASNTSSSVYININSLGVLPVVIDKTRKSPGSNELKANTVYVFKIDKSSTDGQTIALLCGQWQVHGLDVLSNGTTGEVVTISPAYYNVGGSYVEEKKAPLYSKEYFQYKYNCTQVNITVIPNSPFTVQRIGEVLDVKNDQMFSKIDTDAVAVENAIYQNWKNSRLTDSVQLNTILIPFLDVNTKVSYQPQGENEEQQYIIKSITHDLGSMTSSISMYKFYPLYQE